MADNQYVRFRYYYFPFGAGLKLGRCEFLFLCGCIALWYIISDLIDLVCQKEYSLYDLLCVDDSIIVYRDLCKCMDSDAAEV